MNVIERLTITHHEHEGFTYIECGGIFYKGCKRCGGTGHYSFDGFDSICYNCRNIAEYRLGDSFDNEEQAKKWCHGKALARAARERKREAERQKKIAKMEEKVAGIPEDVRNFLLALDLETEKDSFLYDMGANVQYVGKADRPFTERMVSAVRKVMERKAQREAEAVPAPSGRVVITGEVVSAKTKETIHGTQYKILVKDDAGFKVYVSIPKAQADQAYDEFYETVEKAGYPTRDFGPEYWFLGGDLFPGVKGRRITFTATLEVSNDDKSFAFGSRPTKGAWL